MSKNVIYWYLSNVSYRRMTACLLVAMLALPSFCLSASSAAATDKSLKVATAQEHPLEPPDTSSPRATLKTFLKYANNGWRYALEHGKPHPDNEKLARCCLDVSKIPENRWQDVYAETNIKLFDVFNRIPLPALEDVPDSDEMENKKKTSWVMPHTPITIAQVATGPRAGEWLFTPETINRTPEFYRKTRHLPLKPDAVIEDGYAIYRGQTGWMIPAAWQFALPAAAHRAYLDNTLFQWFLVAIVLTLAGTLAWASIHWSRRAMPGRLVSDMRALTGPVMVMLLSAGTLYLIDAQVNITGVVLTVFRVFFDTIFYLAIAWGAILAGRLVLNAILTSTRIDLTRLSEDFTRLAVRLLTFTVILIIFGLWLNSIGIPVLGLLAGLGIGGIAVALAAQRTIENFFGAIMLYTDRPVRIGDFCRFGDKMGTIERIGLRSTRIRTPERSVLNVPNAEFSRLQIENLAHRDQIRLRTTLNLRLETTPEQLQLVLYRVRGLLLDNDDVDNEPARVRLVAIGPLSLDIEILAYIKTTAFDKFLAIQEDLFLEILKEVTDAGTALAPPAQIQYNDTAQTVTSVVQDSSNS